MAGSYTVLSHTADTGIVVEASSRAELFEWAARGMFSLMYDLDALTPTAERGVAVAGSDDTELLVDFLADLLFLSEAEDVVPCTFRAAAAGTGSVVMAVDVAPMEPAMLQGPPIKAVTYHELAVAEQPDGSWRARVVFDV